MNHQYTIETLRELIAVRRDCEEGFRTCAEHACSERLKKIFMIHARECTAAVRELQALIRQLGGDPDTRGPMPGTIARRRAATRSSSSATRAVLGSDS